MQMETKYLNQFHKESTERQLKAIAEMKKSPMNYEKELEKHKRISQIGREMEKEAEKEEE